MIQNTYQTITEGIRNYFSTSQNTYSYYHKYPNFLQYKDQQFPMVILYDDVHLIGINGASDEFNFSLTIIDQCEETIPVIEQTRNNLIRIVKDFINNFFYGLDNYGYMLDNTKGNNTTFVDDVISSDVEHAETIVFKFKIVSTIYEENNPLGL